MSDPKPPPKSGPIPAAKKDELELDLPPKAGPISLPPQRPPSRPITPGSGRIAARPSQVPFNGLGARIGQVLSAITRALVRLTAVLFRGAQAKSGKALSEFQARPEHTRWRAYALGSYSLIAVMTFAFQLWEPNSLQAYVILQKVALPDVTNVFVRNDSKKVWKDVKLTLNGTYTYERTDLQPGQHVLLRIDRFSVYDSNGKTTFAPKDIVPHDLPIDCDRGHHEVELK
ncbi:MAG: hypothetical protein JST92_07030 [Deltaproteobacteria bacterium]|nr:hypothetical protein [Deltaproteobacteria bacterium]